MRGSLSFAQEQWCKKGPPTAELITSYAPQPAMPSSPINPPAALDWGVLRPLTALADKFGALLQNDHQVRGVA